MILKMCEFLPDFSKNLAIQNFVLGLSGGVDSMSLAFWLKQNNFNFRAIYVDHNLHPNSKNWGQFIKDFCAKQGIDFKILTIRLDSLNNLEAKARNLRYQAIKNDLTANEILLTAHHQNDQAETFLLALKRGSGVKGLGAMKALSNWQNMQIYRPLLKISRQIILDFANQNKLEWLEDPSNKNLDFERNFIRHSIIPLLEQKWPNIVQSISKTAQNLQQSQQLLENLLKNELEKLTQNQNFDLTNFQELENLTQKELLRMWLAKHNILMPSQKQLDELLNNVIFATQDKQPILQLQNKQIRRFQNQLFITENAKDFSSLDFVIKNNEILDFAQIGIFSLKNQKLTWKIGNNINFIDLNCDFDELKIKFKAPAKVKLVNENFKREMKKIWKKYQIPTWQRKQTALIFHQDSLLALLTKPNDCDEVQ